MFARSLIPAILPPAARTLTRQGRMGDSRRMHPAALRVTTDRSALMAGDYSPGLEGVIAFETQIAEPDKDGGALRYRGVDIEDLVGQVTFGHVWALLSDGKFGPGLPPA